MRLEIYIYTYTHTHTPQKFNIATQNDALEDVSPFKYAYFWVSILIFVDVIILVLGASRSLSFFFLTSCQFQYVSTEGLKCWTSTSAWRRVVWRMPRDHHPRRSAGAASSVGFLWRGRGVVKKRKQIHRVHYDLEVGSLWLYISMFMNIYDISRIL